MWISDLLTEVNEDRTVNPVTGILGNVSGSTWLGESMIIVNGRMDTLTVNPF
ncbi:MAG: hypothetical protein Ct9H90mP16_03490 [Candidatus Poseidoniales archaeon]|nr:MAG: hypothetical protein Ct9H90mP16_03490 [Candidatus Poseidoniales archaeon]